jgi:hypothetical protein
MRIFNTPPQPMIPQNLRLHIEKREQNRRRDTGPVDLIKNLSVQKPSGRKATVKGKRVSPYERKKQYM